jgi:methionine salvage enolase-phosphatase E1
MVKLHIPKEARDLIDSVNKKIDNTKLGKEQYQLVANAYETHVTGNASPKEIPKKRDLQAYYQVLGKIFGFEQKEIDFLIADDKEVDTSAAFGVLTKILEKDKFALTLFERIKSTEYWLNYCPS